MELPRNIKCIIFDLDGTLANFPIDYESMRKELRTLFDDKDQKFKPLIDSINNLSFDSKTPNILKRALSVVDKYELNSLDGVKLNKEIMDIYSGTELTKIILTRNSSRLVNSFLEKFDLVKPQMILSRDDVVELKPSIEHIQPVFKKFKFDREEYLLIGDSVHDKLIAQSSKINYIEYGS